MTNHSTESELIAELVGAAGRGDRAAQEELLRHYWSLILGVVRTRMKRLAPQLGWREEADDLDQEVALRLLRELPKHDWRGKGAFIAWLKRVADNHIRDRQRFHQARRRDRGAETIEERADEAPRPGRTPESLVDQNRELATLEVQLAELKPEYASAVRLNQAGFSHAEVGELLDCSAEAARKLVARGLSKLQRLRAAQEPRRPGAPGRG